MTFDDITLRLDFLARIEALGGDELGLRGNERHFPELMAAFVPDGFSYEVRDYSRLRRVGNDDLDIELSLSFWPDRDRRKETECTAGRSISTADGEAFHHYLEVGSEIQGNGVGRRLVGSAAAFYAQLGIPQIRLLAADVGRYVWAMCGFQPDGDQMKTKVYDDVEAAALELGFELDPLEWLWDLDQIDEDVTPRELLVAFGGDEESLPDLLKNDLDKPIRLGKALLLCSRTAEWLGKLDIREDDPREQMLFYTGSDGDDGD